MRRQGAVLTRAARAAGVLALLAAAAAPAGCSWGERPARVLVNDRPLQAHAEVRYGRVYADALALARALGLRAVYFPDKPDRGLTLQEGDRRFVHLHTGQNDCHVGGETVRLDAPTLFIHPRTRLPMAPVAFVAEVFGGRATVAAAGPDGVPEVDVRFP